MAYNVLGGGTPSGTGKTYGIGGGSSPAPTPSYSPQQMPQWTPPTMPQYTPPAPQQQQPSTAQMSLPPAPKYQQYQGNPQFQQKLGGLQNMAGGLMDPNSDYYKRLQEQMRLQLGKQAAAGQRSAALRGAYSGFGGGMSPESMATAADIGQAGLEATGEGAAGMALQAPMAGAGIMQQSFAPQLQMEGLKEQSGQFGAGLQQGYRGQDIGAGMQQQQIAAQQASQQAQLQMQQQQMQQQYQLAMMSQMMGGM